MWTLEKFANLAEVVGIVLVIISLAYLATQIGQNTKALRSSAAQSSHDQLLHTYLLMMSSPDLIRIIREGSKDPTILNDDEIGQFMAFWSDTIFVQQNWLNQTKSGALDEELYDSWVTGVKNNYFSVSFKYFWDNRKFFFTQYMQDYVEESLKTKPTVHGFRTFDFSSRHVKPDAAE